MLSSRRCGGKSAEGIVSSRVEPDGIAPSLASESKNAKNLLARPSKRAKLRYLTTLKHAGMKTDSVLARNHLETCYSLLEKKMTKT